MCNENIRTAIRSSGFHQWRVADELGISEATLCRWLRKELPQEKQQEIIQALSRLESHSREK